MLLEYRFKLYRIHIYILVGVNPDIFLFVNYSKSKYTIFFINKKENRRNLGFSCLLWQKVYSIFGQYVDFIYFCAVELNHDIIMSILSTLKASNKVIYIVLVSALTLALLLGYVPGLEVLSSFVTPPVALFLGLAFALLCGQPFAKFNKGVSKKLLQYSVIGLGFGMNLQQSLASGKEGMIFTIVSVIGTMVIGMFIGRRVLKMNRDAAYLISSGTAICGGSAIAAVGPVIKANESDMSVALATIFILNAIALFVFPILGEWIGLTQQQFGTWAAIAIHDTSSVVGAGAAYGEEALKVATTIKLTRALWIIPLALVTSVIFKNNSKKISIPWFILWFIVAIVVNTYLLNGVPEVGKIISGVARKGLIITMFFIGASLSSDVLKAVGLKPLIQGIVLWIVISISSLLYILYVS